MEAITKNSEVKKEKKIGFILMLLMGLIMGIIQIHKISKINHQMKQNNQTILQLERKISQQSGIGSK